MVKLDAAELPAPVARAVLARGTQVPPLAWHQHPNRAAKTALDELHADTALLGREVVASSEMAAAVRALLYLWNGWPAEAAMYAHGAPELERHFIQALVERQVGAYAAAKAAWQQVGEHPVFTELVAFAQQVIPAKSTGPLKRLRDVIEFAGQWEPHLFTDLCDQAASGKLDLAGEETVRRLQCCEFELVLAHCCEAATGAKLRRARSPAPRRATPAVPRRPATPPAPAAKPEPAPAGPRKPRPVLKPVELESGIGIACPKCRAVKMVPESRRGATDTCPKCKTVFQVPARPAATRPGGGA